MIYIYGFDYTGSKPYVYFRYKGIAMDAELDPCVIKPVVIKGTVEGYRGFRTVDIKFHEYEELQKQVTLFAKGII